MFCPNCKGELKKNVKFAEGVKECRVCGSRFFILVTHCPAQVEVKPDVPEPAGPIPVELPTQKCRFNSAIQYACKNKWTYFLIISILLLYIFTKG